MENVTTAVSIEGGLAEYPRLRRTLRNCLSTVAAIAERLNSSRDEKYVKKAAQVRKDIEAAVPAADRIFNTKAAPFKVSHGELQSLIRCVNILLEDCPGDADQLELLLLVEESLIETRDASIKKPSGWVRITDIEGLLSEDLVYVQFLILLNLLRTKVEDIASPSEQFLHALPVMEALSSDPTKLRMISGVQSFAVLQCIKAMISHCASVEAEELHSDLYNLALSFINSLDGVDFKAENVLWSADDCLILGLLNDAGDEDLKGGVEVDLLSQKNYGTFGMTIQSVRDFVQNTDDFRYPWLRYCSADEMNQVKHLLDSLCNRIPPFGVLVQGGVVRCTMEEAYAIYLILRFYIDHLEPDAEDLSEVLAVFRMFASLVNSRNG